MRKGAILAGSILALASAYALDAPEIKDLGELFGFVGKALHGILNNPYTLYFVPVVFAFILFYVVYGAPAQRLRFFEGQGGIGLNALGKLFCVALSGLTCTAIFAMKGDALRSSKNFLAPFGIYGAVLCSILMFLLIWRGFRDQTVFGLGPVAMGALGAVMAWIFFSFLAGDGNLLGFGIIFLGFFIIWLIIRGFWRVRHRHLTRRTVRQAERQEEREEREIQGT